MKGRDRVLEPSATPAAYDSNTRYIAIYNVCGDLARERHCMTQACVWACFPISPISSEY
jgi:hypothetical protein